MKCLACFVFLLFVVAISDGVKHHRTKLKPIPCRSVVYCEGPLLHVVQTARIFNDSKTFVDMAMKFSVNLTIENFELMMRRTQNKPTKEQVKDFVFENFKATRGLIDFYPRDFHPEPKLVKEIDNKEIREFTKSIVGIWPQLTKRVAVHVIEHPETQSLIPVKNAVVIPGGRFQVLC